MRPITLRLRCALQVGGAALISMLWLAAVPRFAAQADFSDAGGVLAASIALAVVLPLVVAVRLAARTAADFHTLASLAKALIGGAEPAAAPALASAEAREAYGALTHAASAVRQREATMRAADRLKDDFLAMLGHELRNPLSAQAAAAHVLRKCAPGDAAGRQAAEVISRQVEQMNRLIEDLLDVTRVTRGKVSLNRRPVALAQVIERAVKELRAAGRLEHHRIVLELAEVWAHADEARMVQIVCNLVGNALKFTPPGGCITLSLRRDGGTAVLRVRDDGAGMPPELAAQVFELFVQGDDADRRRSAGLGIGLALVRRLAELHGGKAFAASSGPGEGSVFTVSLPAIEAQGAAAAPTLTVEPHSRHRILLVEDNADTRNTMFEALELEGHRVYEACDGPSGLRTLTALRPDVAVIDIGLPGLNGYEVASALHDCPERRKMVLIAMTGFEQPDSLRRAREAGFDDYVTKPIEPERLVRLIDAAFAARRKRMT